MFKYIPFITRCKKTGDIATDVVHAHDDEIGKAMSDTSMWKSAEGKEILFGDVSDDPIGALESVSPLRNWFFGIKE